MRKICIVNEKGGVGKTTSTVNIAAGLSRMDKKVLILDLDPQGSIGTCLNDVSQKDMFDFLMEGAHVRECIKSMGKNLDIITSKDNLVDAELAFVGKKNNLAILREKLTGLSAYDYVLIDCPPSLSLLTQNALLYANEAFIPVSTDFLGLKGLRKVYKLVKSIGDKFDHDVKVTKIIPTLYDARSRHCTKILTEIKNEYYELVSDPIRVNTKLKEAPQHGQSIFKYAKSSRGAKDYMKVVQSIVYDESRYNVKVPSTNGKAAVAAN